MTIARPVTIAPPAGKPWCFKCRVEIFDGGPRYRCAACADRETEDRLARTRAFVLSAVPKHFQWASSLGVPELSERVSPPSAVARLRSFTGNTLVLSGPPGAGKTSLGTAVLMERALRMVKPAPRDERDEPYGYKPCSTNEPGMFVTTFALAKARREHRLGDGEADLIEQAVSTGVLLLDELGAEAGRGDTAVPEVIHERHAADRVTIFATPFELGELEARYGAGIARRIFEGAYVVRLGGRS